MEPITIGIINYNGLTTLPQTIESLRLLDYPAKNVIVVDNQSTDGSYEWVVDNCPDVTALRMDKNIGPNYARNAVLARATGEYVFLMDNDIVFEPDMLAHLVSIMDELPDAAVAHPEFDDPAVPDVHHYNGGWIHFVCALIAREKPNPALPRPRYEPFDVVAGAAMLLRREIALQLGGFDEDYFINWDDGDFMARATTAGYQCINVPGTIALHKGKYRGTSHVYRQVRDRWQFILKLYSWRTLLLIWPMLLLFELSQMALVTLKGALRDYIRANFDVLRMLPHILAKRRRFQRMKTVRDRDWLHAGEMYVPDTFVNHGLLRRLYRAYNGIFNAYWRLIRPLC
ncbi:MAG: glycosyltransferase family 2 protein [Anaerolineae bacterium]|nr:glycosyltransferase family 2 protein [Anaerolineae bacterium]